MPMDRERLPLKTFSGELVQETELFGQLTNSTGETEEIEFKAVAPGRYEGVFQPDGEGVYLANIGLEGDQGSEQLLAGVIVPYSSEFDF